MLRASCIDRCYCQCQFRSSWSVDHTTGVYSASIPSPTGIPVDPALTAHGVEQSWELGRHLMTVEPPVEAVYSSPYYRCLQTITPFVELQQERHSKRRRGSSDGSSPACTVIRPEHGLCEWFGSAPFEHPGPASPSVLKSLFPALDDSYVSAQHPPSRGETLAQLQARLTATMQSIIDRCDAEDRRAVVLCTHAAVVIMLGRILTGVFPETVDADDFRAFTCGLSVYRRRLISQDEQGPRGDENLPKEKPNPRAVVGAWSCEANSDCSFLTCGEERGWKFSGDEEFPDTGSLGQDASESKL
ncbi:RNA polymerase III transcription initiation factor complex component [Trichoderma longibrachiatum ATCC 18648]|uniref:RNA polymerase III transcription initiation factor complex component n=1 Tax=Trichoderma longibrachiatum ATCC 18648 TaxID=983965 RepID=A0A2T4CCM0_TRILO|nr:RNA polymerase III transcription initiation factor complex component [Trichoderma longibrachiatum ATCC 18648]